MLPAGPFPFDILLGLGFWVRFEAVQLNRNAPESKYGIQVYDTQLASDMERQVGPGLHPKSDIWAKIARRGQSWR